MTKDEMYVVLALFMLMGIIQKPTLRCFTVTESHGECKRIEGQDEEEITKREIQGLIQKFPDSCRHLHSSCFSAKQR